MTWSRRLSPSTDVTNAKRWWCAPVSGRGALATTVGVSVPRVMMFRWNPVRGAGFNAFGIAAGGGAGLALAQWVHDGMAPYDLSVADIRRFGRPHRNTDWVGTRTLEAYA